MNDTAKNIVNSNIKDQSGSPQGESGVLVLTGQEAQKKISQMIRGAKRSVLIASPWITKTAFKTLFGTEARRSIEKGELNVVLLMRYACAFDVSCNSALISYARSLGVEIRVAKTIHAKTVIVDGREIITGSFNLTGSGLDSEEVRELGAWTDQPAAVAKGLSDFEKLKASTKLIPINTVGVVLAATLAGYVVLSPIELTQGVSGDETDDEEKPVVGAQSDWGIDINVWKPGATLTVQRDSVVGANSVLEVVDVISSVNTDKIDQELAMQGLYGKNSWNTGPSLLPIALATLSERNCYVLAKTRRRGDLAPIVNPGEFVVMGDRDHESA